MTATKWAVTLQCDYPGCRSVGDAVARDHPPAGWLALDHNIQILDAYGNRLTDFCTLHADMPLCNLAAAMQAARVKVT